MQLDCSYCLVVDWFLRSQKVDLLNGRKACWNAPIFKTMKQQSKDVQLEFNGRLTEVITQFENQGLNTELYYTMRKGGKLSICFPQGQSGAISICRCIVKQACLIKMVGNYRDGVTFWHKSLMGECE
ncbi:hypothetical protein Vadar_021961 [Vaccinium darrowii]|uniref:Uncharacterized protein n=1 Tax=Vaccinium darrowii TaxID=229202 RepID=A0ACB7XJ53_9ERIC|nr:hypothetical protein Vadar_021961 [Vaccinium darrowii]